MATISRHHAVAQVPLPAGVGKVEFGGYIAWLAWLGLHLVYLVGFKNRIATLFSWANTFTMNTRGQLTTTSQMVYARLAMDLMEKQTHDDGPELERGVAELELEAQAATADSFGGR
jgi:NADH dehydrogenase